MVWVSGVHAVRAHIVARSNPLDLPFSMSMHPSSPFIPPFVPPRSARASTPSCQEIFVTESCVVLLGEQTTPKVLRLSGPAAPSIRATIIGQLKPGESVRVTCHPIIIRCPRGGSTTYPRDRAWVAVTNSGGERGWQEGESHAEMGAGSETGGKVFSERRRMESTIPITWLRILRLWWSSWSLFLPFSLSSLSSFPPLTLRMSRSLTALFSRVLSLTILLRVNQCGQHALSLTP